MMKKLFCDTCQTYTQIKSINEKKSFQVKDINIEAEITITRCVICGSEVYDRLAEIHNDRIVYDAYRLKKGLLTSQEIKSIRVKYGLSQKHFAQVLGFGEKTITRYENGSIQDETHDNLMRLMDNEWNFYRILSLKHPHTSGLDKIIKQYLSIKKEETFTYDPCPEDRITYQTIGEKEEAYNGCIK